MFKKIFLILVLFTSLSFSQEAKSIPSTKKLYIGYSTGSGSGEFNLEDTSGFTYNSEFDTKTTNLKIGVEIRSKYRIELVSNTIDAEFPNGNLRKIKGFDINVHALFPLTKDKTLNYVIGAGSGINRIDFNAYGDALPLKGISANFSAGLLFNLTETLGIDLSYQVRAIVFEEYVDSFGNTATEIYAYSTIHAGVNLKF